MSRLPLNTELLCGYFWLRKHFSKKESFTRHEMVQLKLPQSVISFIVNYWKKEQDIRGEIIYRNHERCLQSYYRKEKPLYG